MPAAAPDPAAPGTFLFVAVDGGARETLAPAAQACGIALESVGADTCTLASHWRHTIEARAPDLLVSGTSDSHRGRSVEAAARRAAHTAGIPIVAIEDYPGNYNGVSGGEADLVLVESEPARELYARRLGNRAPPVEVMSAARYDGYRARVRELRETTHERWRQAAATCVLWAGQPETQDCVVTLEALLPVLRGHNVELLFKAHPRDPGHAGGVYRELIESAGMRFQDLTAASVADALDGAPRLVLTQFSSVAVEAGFYGIPSLCVLLPEAGSARLLAKKSYEVPLFCTAGAAAFAEDEAKVASTFMQALTDKAFRDALIVQFDGYFEAASLKTPALLDRLRLAAAK